jgi:hypothetical protein
MRSSIESSGLLAAHRRSTAYLNRVPYWCDLDRGRRLHNQRGQLLAALLVLKGDRRIVTINVPWYLKE